VARRRCGSDGGHDGDQNWASSCQSMERKQAGRLRSTSYKIAPGAYSNNGPGPVGRDTRERISMTKKILISLARYSWSPRWRSRRRQRRPNRTGIDVKQKPPADSTTRLYGNGRTKLFAQTRLRSPAKVPYRHVRDTRSLKHHTGYHPVSCGRRSNIWNTTLAAAGKTKSRCSQLLCVLHPHVLGSQSRV